MTRRANDFYETPPWQTRALLKHQRITGTILEPCVGDGSIARVLCESFYRWPSNPAGPSRNIITNDIDPQRAAEFHHDAADEELYRQIAQSHGGVDWVITNPPYQMPLCTNIVKLAVRHARKGVAMLLRISFREPTAKVNPRGPFLKDHPLSRVLTLPRHSYTGNGKSDSATTEWAIWVKYGADMVTADGRTAEPILSLYRADVEFTEASA